MHDQFAVFQKRKGNLKKDHISGCRSGQVKTKDIGMFFFYQGILTIFGD